jgi:hypothetical protein
VKLALLTAPTWKAFVALPVPGRDRALEFTFRHRGKDELQQFLEALKGMSDEQAVEAVLVGWALDDEFNADSIAALCQAVPGAGYAIVQTYLRESTGIKE